MITEQTRRRHRGRAIRKARRVRTAMPPELHPALACAEEIWARICAVVRDDIDFIRVFAARMTPLPLTPRDGAGARRQLLHNGRAPRKGGR